MGNVSSWLFLSRRAQRLYQLSYSARRTKRNVSSLEA